MNSRGDDQGTRTAMVLASVMLFAAWGAASATPYQTGGDQSGTYASGGDEKSPGLVDVPTREVGRTPAEFALRMRSPNPARSTAIVEFDLPRPALVVVRFFDIQGRQMSRANHRRTYEAGTHRLEIPLNRLPSGQYICRFSFRTPGTGAMLHEETTKILRLE